MKKESVALRILIVGCLIVLLLIPLFMIQTLIAERQINRNVSIKEISKSWAGPQTIAGPILTTITTGEKINKEGNKVETKQRNFYLPENLTIEAKVIPEKRYRGIYSAIVYKTDLKIKGSFSNNKIKEILSNPSVKESYLSFNINDPKGIQQDVVVKWNNISQSIIPGLKEQNIFTNGFHSDILISKDQPDNMFEINLTLNGVDELNFVPIGKNTEVKVSSTWNDPSFTGNFLSCSKRN